MDFKFDLQMFANLTPSNQGPKSAFVGGSWIKESEVQQSADVLAYYDGTNYYVKADQVLV